MEDYSGTIIRDGLRFVGLKQPSRNKRRWSVDEDEYLAGHWRRMSHAELGEHLGRSRGGVRTHCWRLGLVELSDDWPEEEVAYLNGVYESAGVEGAINQRAIAERLGRSVAAVGAKAQRMKLTNPDRQKHWDEENRGRVSESNKLWHQEHEHPRGFSGHTHSSEVRLAQSARSKRVWDDPDHYLNSEEYRQTLSDRGMEIQKGNVTNPYSRCKGGKRADLGDMYFRSAWEADIARYLNFLQEHGEIAGWDYEPECFEFHEIKRGTRSYTPDFRVWLNDEKTDYQWWEVKGWMDAKSKTRLERFEKYYPQEYARFVLIDRDAYRAIARQKRLISPEWEGRS